MSTENKVLAPDGNPAEPVVEKRKSMGLVVLAGTCLALIGGISCWAQTSRRVTQAQTTADLTWTTSGVVTTQTIGRTSTGGFFVADSGGSGQLLESRTFIGPVPTLQQIRMTAREIPAVALAPAEYLKLAMKIKLESAATDEARILDAFHRMEMKTYDYDRVDEYLYRQAISQGTNVRWVWKPMRDGDQAVTSESIGRNGQSIFPGFGLLWYGLYGKAIPARVLQTTAKVLAEIPDAVFLVSDYEVVKPDPFLAVTTKKLLDQNKIWIIDVWAEPGFSDQVPEMKMGPAPIL